VVLANGRLEGRLSSDQLGADLLTAGGRVALAVDGELAGGLDELQLTVSVDGPEPVHLTALPAELASALDLRGSARGVLDLGAEGGPVLRDLNGAFGSLTVGGDVVIAPLRAELALASSAVQLEGPASGTVSVPASTLVAAEAGITWNGTLAYESASVGAAALGSGNLDATFALPAEGSWNLVADSRSRALSATASAEGFDVTLDGRPVDIGDDQLAVSLSGSATGRLGEPIDPIDVALT